MAQQIIRLKVDGDRLTVDPYEQEVGADDVIEWEPEPKTAEWVVWLADAEPFDIDGAQPGSHEVRKGHHAKVNGKKKGVTIPYRAAVCERGQLVAVFDCPTIIIKPRLAPPGTSREAIETLKPAVEKVMEIIPAASKLFPHGITLIDASVNLTSAEFKLRIQGPDKASVAPGKRGA